MTASPTISVRLLQVTLDCAEQLGVDRADASRASGLDGIDLSDPDGRAPVPCAVRLGFVLRERLGPAAGIRLGEVIATERPTVLGYLIANCKDLGEAYRTIHRYRSIVLELTPPVLEVESTEARFGCVYPASFVASSPSFIELLVTFWLSKGRRLTGVDWVPRAIHLQSTQTDPAWYERVFRCPVTNTAARTQILFDPELLDKPVLDADPNLLNYLTPIAEGILEQLSRGNGFQHEVQSCIARVLKEGDPQLQTVARELNVSSRTLQRRLSEENTSFGVLLDEARRVAAFEYLKDRRISVADTAFLLGFSEPSTFHRAFKRWTGMTPATYRRSATA